MKFFRLSCFILFMITVLSACTNDSHELTSSTRGNIQGFVAISSEENSKNSASSDPTTSWTETSSPEQTTTSSEGTVSSNGNNTSSADVSSQKPISSAISGNDSKCTHQVSSIYELAGDTCLGVENRTEVDPLSCTSEIEVIYQCPICRKTAIYEILPPKGHNYSETEEIVYYPTADKNGCKGKKCLAFKCKDFIETETIPKRGGDYSGISSGFKLTISENQMEYYRLESPEIRINDTRTWGSVPSIEFNGADNRVIISTVDRSNAPVTFDILIDMTYLDQGYWAIIDLLDEGGFVLHYGGIIG